MLWRVSPARHSMIAPVSASFRRDVIDWLRLLSRSPLPLIDRRTYRRTIGVVCQSVSRSLLRVLHHSLMAD